MELGSCDGEKISSVEHMLHAAIEIGSAQGRRVPWHAKHAQAKDDREGKWGKRFMVQERLLA